MILASDIQAEAFNVWNQIAWAFQSQLTWIALGVFIVCKTPNKRYAQAWKGLTYAWNRWIVKADPSVKPPTVTPVVVPTPEVVVDPTRIKTAKEMKDLYDDFCKQKEMRIAELEGMLAAEREELKNLKLISSNMEVAA